ncbi:hypothetical protein [Natrinema marinum]|uniref:hypothetical protein n=1 Tax=Natrinema marinum TaxID=2961598 RepID=UPI0020C8B83E|nr:hypothetical protein [Natrinema marinum]
MADGDKCKIFRVGLNTEAGSCGTGVDCKPSGDDGWSASLILENPAGLSDGTYELATYEYHLGEWSDNNPPDSEAHVTSGEWFKIGAYVRMNSITDGEANPDGDLRIWLDDELIYEREERRWTTTNDQAIEYAGPFLYYGGGETAPTDMAATYDDHTLFFNTGSE